MGKIEDMWKREAIVKARTIRKLRLEIIALEREVGGLCKKNTKLEAELKLLRGGDHVG